MGRPDLGLTMPAASAPTRHKGRPGMLQRRRELLLRWYEAMHTALGPSSWWPGESPFEVVVGAVLTQNTAWANVEKALLRLRDADLLHPAAMAACPDAELEEAIRPAGFFRQKAKTLRRVLALLQNLESEKGVGEGIEAGAGSDCSTAALRLGCFDALEMDELRERLLAVPGIGPETADCIVLYAAGRPSFVVDAYTRRIAHRHGQVEDDISYADLRDFFMDALPEDAALFNEYHALLVRVGHNFCRKSKPLCSGCPLESFLEYAPE